MLVAQFWTTNLQIVVSNPGECWGWCVIENPSKKCSIISQCLIVLSIKFERWGNIEWRSWQLDFWVVSTLSYMNILESGFRDGTLDMFYVKMWQWTGSNMTLPTCLRGNMQNSCLKYLNSWETVSKLRKKECSKGINLKVFTFLTSHWNPFQIFSKHSSSNLIESILIIKIIRPVPVKEIFKHIALKW